MCFSLILVTKISQFWGKWVFPCSVSEGPAAEKFSTTMAKNGNEKRLKPVWFKG